VSIFFKKSTQYISTFKLQPLFQKQCLTINEVQVKSENSIGGCLACPMVFFDWLIDYLRFYVPVKNISLIWRRHHCRWRAAKFRPMPDAQGLWAGRDLYCATPAVTRDLGFSGLIRRTAPFSRLLRHTRGCGGPILT
jgi:hypothetical protein